MNIYDEIYEQIKRIPKGYVSTTVQIARLAGIPHLVSAVDFAIRKNPSPEQIPCYRVLDRGGTVSSFYEKDGRNTQTEMLRAEGIDVSGDGRVNLSFFLWRE